MRKNKSFKKLRKLLSDPNLYFYDLFRKRVFGATAKPQTKQTKESTISNIEMLTIDLDGITPFLIDRLQLRAGAIDGKDSSSLLIWSGNLYKLFSIIAGVKIFNSLEITIYSSNGAFSHTAEAGSDLDIATMAKGTSSLHDFSIEMSSLAGTLEVLSFCIYDLAKDGTARVRSPIAWIKRFNHFDIEDVFPAPTPAEFPIDAVYTWVNHQDSHWQELWKSNFTTTNFDPDRFTSNDELKYSLRSLEKYSPWLRRIFIVSNCQQPSWLNNHKKIVWVDHSEIYPKDESYLPVFNSHSIETCLHRIPELSEHFIYLNDDFVLSQKCRASDFFDELGRSIAYLEPYGMVPNSRIKPEFPDYLKAASNSRKLLARDFPTYQPRQLHRHVPYALLKSVLSKIEIAFPEEISLTRKAKVRAESDINLTSFLFHHYSIAAGSSIKGDATGLIVRPTNIDSVLGRDLYRYKFLCFNDGNGSSIDSTYKDKTKSFFEKRLNIPAPWENLSR